MAIDRDPISEAHSQWVRHGWPEAADGMAMVTSVVRVQQLLMEKIESVLRPLDLTFARYEILRLLSFVQSGSMPMTRLGSLLQVHPTSVTSAGLNAHVFEEPGLPVEDVLRLTELLGELRAASGDHVATPAPTSQ
jgi:hypothetical protein